MTLLIISPDYASHLLPLATLGTAWRDAGERVVVATGPATASIVESFGFERVNLQLGKGSNPGVIRAEDLNLVPGREDMDSRESGTSGGGLQELLDITEKKAIQEALGRTGHGKTAAARLLGVTFRSLRYRMERLGME